MNLKEALEIAKVNCRRQAAFKGLKTELPLNTRCKVSICKMRGCKHIEVSDKDQWDGHRRSWCNKYNSRVSNLYMHKTECQKEWGKVELKTSQQS